MGPSARIMPRKIIPGGRPIPIRRPMPARNLDRDNEMQKTFKKLREIGK